MLGSLKLNLVSSTSLQGLVLPFGQGLRLSPGECATLFLSLTVHFRFNNAKSFHSFLMAYLEINPLSILKFRVQYPQFIDFEYIVDSGQLLTSNG